MVLVKMLMEIDPLPMRGSLVMTMVMISPLPEGSFPGRTALPEPQIGFAKFPPRGGGVSSRKLAYDFSSDERLHIVEDGHRRATRGPTRQGARPPPSCPGCGSPLVFSFAQYFLLFPKITFVEFQDFWSCAEQVFNICSFSSPEFQLPAFSLLM